jgi:hypothetical protein
VCAGAVACHSSTGPSAKLSPAAFAAWAVRGVTSVAQTLNPGNPTCGSFSSNIGQPDILSFTPPL